MSKENYLSLYFDNLSRTASLLEGLMDSLDDDGDPAAEILESFAEVKLEAKASIDERAATIRSLEVCEKKLVEHKLMVNHKLQQLKKLHLNLKEKTLKTLADFNNQPFRGDYCQLQANNTRGKVELGIHTSKVSLSNVIEPDTYGSTDIPSSCLNKVTYYYVNKDALYQELKSGLEIEDAKLVKGRCLRIKDLV